MRRIKKVADEIRVMKKREEKSINRRKIKDFESYIEYIIVVKIFFKRVGHKCSNGIITLPSNGGRGCEISFKIQEKLVPELISIAENRYTILRNIYYNQPIGRRALAEKPISVKDW